MSFFETTSKNTVFLEIASFKFLLNALLVRRSGRKMLFEVSKMCSYEKVKLVFSDHFFSRKHLDFRKSGFEMGGITAVTPAKYVF